MVMVTFVFMEFLCHDYTFTIKERPTFTYHKVVMVVRMYMSMKQQGKAKVLVTS